MPKTTLNIATINQGKVQFYPSGSNYQPTSSAPATAAQFDIHIPSTVGGDWISNSELNPYIVIPLISSSYTGTGFDEELIIRFFTSSHFGDYRTGSFPPDGGGWNVNSVSASLYYTGSNTSAKYRDVLLTPTASGAGTATSLRNIIFDLITGSSAYNSGMISASKQGNFTSSIYLINARGKVNPPTVYTGSLASNAGFSINIISTGSGTLNFAENYLLSVNSASLSIEFDEDDPTSMVFSSPTSSLGVSRTNSALLYFSGSGKIGFNTKNPKNAIDFKADSFKIRSTDGKREMQFSNEGKLTTKKFSNSAVSESIGSEIILSYTPGTFLSPKKAQVGETIGTINFVDESFNTSTLSKYFKSGSVAQISSTVRKVTGLGAAGDLQFKVNVDPEAPQDTLVSFMDIDPLTHGATVYFPYGITSNTHITASGDISSSANIYAADYYASGQKVRPNLYWFGVCDAVTLAANDNLGAFPSTDVSVVSFLATTLTSDASVFTLSSDEVTITRAGVYKFTYNVLLEIGAGSNRTEGAIGILRDRASTITLIDGSRSSTYNRFAAGGVSRMAGSVSMFIDVAVDDSFYIGFYKEEHQTSNTQLQTVPSGTTWTIEAVT
tara:strand:+ start:2419 stop:4248 length:1830 start_codon:yes stop_codon:yes gene_type:complete